MPAGVFAIGKDGSLIEMKSADFESEEVLQVLIEKYPQVLAGDQIDPVNPRRWIMVTREAGIPDSDITGSRWAVDHLLIDQEGIPTLVEVKRSSDSRIRREVVGQMLDYASNAVAYWPVESIKAWFETRCNEAGEDPYQLIKDLVGVEDEDEFWMQVKTNLQARRLRLVFVADSIPRELTRIIEFLNEQMDPTEVLGIELSRYRGNDGLEALVPRVIGLTSAADVRKRSSYSSGPPWTPERFLADLEVRQNREFASIGRDVLTWAEKNATRVWWGHGRQVGSFIPVFERNGNTVVPFSVWSYGRIEVNFQYIKDRLPYSEIEKRRELADALEGLLGITISEASLIKRPSFQLDRLLDEKKRTGFLSLMERTAEEILETG